MILLLVKRLNIVATWFGLSFGLIFGLLWLLLPSQSESSETCNPIQIEKVNQQSLREIPKALIAPFESAKDFFSLACQLHPGQTAVDVVKIKDGLEGHIKPSTFGTMIPAVDRQNRQTKDFLNLVLAKIKQGHELNARAAQEINDCTASTPPSNLAPPCEARAQSWLAKDLPQIAQAARSYLALAMSSNERKDDRDPVHINRQLSSLGTYKESPWQPLSDEEAKISEGKLKEIILEVGAKIPLSNDEAKSATQRRKKIQEIREIYIFVYQALMGVHPVLQNITSASPSKAEVNQAAQKTLYALALEKHKLSSMEASLRKPFNLGRAGNKTYPAEVLDILKYRTEVEQVLLEHPEFCGLALTLRQVEENRGETQDGIKAVAFVGSWFLGPISSMLAGAAMGSWSLGQSFLTYRNSEMRVLARLNSAEGSNLHKLIQNPDPDLIFEGLAKDISAVRSKVLTEAEVARIQANESSIGSTLMLVPGGIQWMSPHLARVVRALRARAFPSAAGP